jgi:DNA-binding response OmpR family regulator
MWEKIVLNLVSNAFKFTFDGEIELTLRPGGDGDEIALDHQKSGPAKKFALLTVRDTGVGIPEEAMPKLFERFYRVENTRSRTQEGTGIGLALVQELVKLHGGVIRAKSRLGAGTTFTVAIPFGSAHLPANAAAGAIAADSAKVGAQFALEANSWLPESSPEPPTDAFAPPRPAPAGNGFAGGAAVPHWARARILLADDNADMRAYLARLLAEHFDVEPVRDGVAALEAARRRPPDLILSDVMMPNLDGFGLIREIRTDPELKALPVILLSARAGEESRVDGLQQGADDYLIKPFSARELLARVGAQLSMAQLRRQATAALEANHRELRERADELRAFNRVAVGRELRMIELKRELNCLCQRLGQPPRYPMDPEDAPRE